LPWFLIVALVAAAAGPWLRMMLCGVSSGIARKMEEEKTRGNKCSGTATAVEKEIRTIYDMVAYLTGRPLPGINLNCALPSDLSARVKQIIQQHSILLMFIRSHYSYYY